MRGAAAAGAEGDPRGGVCRAAVEQPAKASLASTQRLGSIDKHSPTELFSPRWGAGNGRSVCGGGGHFESAGLLVESLLTAPC